MIEHRSVQFLLSAVSFWMSGGDHDAWLIFTDLQGDDIVALWLWVQWRVRASGLQRRGDIVSQTGDVLFVTGEGWPRVKAARLTKLLRAWHVQDACEHWRVLPGTGSHDEFPAEELEVTREEMDACAPLLPRAVMHKHISDFLADHPAARIVCLCPPRDLLHLVLEHQAGRAPDYTASAHLILSAGQNVGTLLAPTEVAAGHMPGLSPEDIAEFLRAFARVDVVQSQAMGREARLPLSVREGVHLWKHHDLNRLCIKFECEYLPCVADEDARFQARALWVKRDMAALAALPCFSPEHNSAAWVADAARCLQGILAHFRAPEPKQVEGPNDAFYLADVLAVAVALQPARFGGSNTPLGWSTDGCTPCDESGVNSPNSDEPDVSVSRGNVWLVEDAPTVGISSHTKLVLGMLADTCEWINILDTKLF